MRLVSFATGYTDCSAAVSTLLCSTEFTTMNVPEGDLPIDLSCSFFDNALELPCSSQSSGDGSGSACSVGAVMACADYVGCIPDTVGDGNCDPALNCKAHGYDQGDCSSHDFFSQAESDGIYCDCLGVCITTADCELWSGGVEGFTCANVFDYILADSQCDEFNPLDPGLITDCKFFNYDNGACLNGEGENV